MIASLPSPGSVEGLQRLIEFSRALIPPRGWVLICDPEQKTKVTVHSCNLFRWTRSNDDGQVVDYFGMTAAGAIQRYGFEQLRKALIKASVDAFSKVIDEALA